MNKCMSVCRTVALLLILILTFGFTVFAEPEEDSKTTKNPQTAILLL